MRGVLLIAVMTPTLLSSGCALPAYHETVGWHFSIGTPGTISTPVTVQTTEGPLTMGGVAAAPVAPTLGAAPARAMLFAAQQPIDQGQCVPYGPSGPVRGPTLAQLAQQDGCTLNDVCDRLGRIEQRLTKAEALPMPKGNP